MPRPKGALNKRTRAALHEAQHGEFESGGRATINYLLGIVRNRAAQLENDAVHLSQLPLQEKTA